MSMTMSKVISTAVVPLLCLILTLLPWGAAHSQPTDEDKNLSPVKQHLQKGTRHLRKERYKKAIEELEIARKLSREPCVRCLKMIALAYYRSESFEDAAKAYEELVDLEPEFPLALLQRLVRIYQRIGTPEKAIAAFETFLENSDEPAEMIPIYNELGIQRLRPGTDVAVHRGDAAAAFRSALDLAAGRSNLLRRNLAEALWQLGSKDKAIAVLHTLAKEDEESWQSLSAVQRNPELVKREARIRSTWTASMPSADRPSEAFVVNDKPCSRPYKSSNTVEPIVIEGDVRSPRKIFSPAPQYTEKTRKGRIQGIVVVRAIIDKHGCVRETQVLRGPHPDLIEQAVSAIRKWKFSPATLHGQPVDVYMELSANFRLQ